MDLFAYSQIDALKLIAKHNAIEVPRLRGYRLMSEETALSAESIQSSLEHMTCRIYDDAMTSCPRFRPESNCSEYSLATDRLRRKYLILETVNDTTYDGTPFSYEVVKGIKWDKIHGKNRKAIKFAVKKAVKAVKTQLETFNKYVGRSDILYIHARIGGGNWLHYGGAELEKKPWFVEKVDDYFDETYCDIYAKIEQVSEELLNSMRQEAISGENE